MNQQKKIECVICDHTEFTRVTFTRDYEIIGQHKQLSHTHWECSYCGFSVGSQHEWPLLEQRYKQVFSEPVT